jgi:hypothetical protein
MLNLSDCRFANHLQLPQGKHKYALRCSAAAWDHSFIQEALT